MGLLTQYKRLKYIDLLISRSATGTPKNLAQKLNISEITVYRYIREMKELGAPIKYCRSCNSYKYTEEQYKFEIELE
jgi:predicted DNA-binding transcriptional regulator YafY